MATFTEQDLNGSSFFKVRLQDSTLEQVDLSGAMLRNVNLTRVKVRGADLTDLELDGEAARLTVHGVDVIPLVEAELDRRHPERAAMRARTPEELRAGWAGLEAMWASTVARARAMPTGTLDVSVDGEWTFTQTLRHLILATDAWLGEAIGKQEKPFHPLGMLFWQGVGEEAEFGLLRERLRVSESVLSKQVKALEEAGYVAIRKASRDGRVRTWARHTAAGRAAYRGHVAALRAIVGAG